jgi:hypothetical protein
MSTVSKHSNARPRNEQVAGRRRSSKGKARLRTANYAAHAFLKHRFLPLYEPSKNELPDRKQTEKGFFHSLEILSGTMALMDMNLSGRPYPYNILLAHWHASKQLRETRPDAQLYILQDEQEDVCLGTSEVYNTGTNLYYIPVLPLYRLLQNRKGKRAGQLLLSVFAYLYHEVGVPYYRDTSSYLYYHFEMMEEWLADDAGSYEDLGFQRCLSEIRKAGYYGDVMLRRLFNKCHLKKFRERLTQFNPQNDWETGCKDTAQAVWELWQRYPAHNLYSHIESVADNCWDETVRIEQYVSFTADHSGWLADNVQDMINNEFNEYSQLQEPVIYKIFQEQETTGDDNLDFERKLFPLIWDLCALLNQLP